MVAGLAPGDHACLAFDDDRGYLTPAAEFVRAGIRENHKVLYFVDDSRRHLIEPLVTDAVTLLSAPEVYRRGGPFDADRMNRDEDPLLRMRVSAGGSPTLRLSGEIDLSNEAAVAAVVRDLATRGPFTIDVSALRFVDCATAGLLIRTALAAPEGLHLRGASRPMRNLLELCAGSRPVPLHLEGCR